MSLIHALNIDSIDDPKALIAKLSVLPVKPILGVVVDEGRTAEEALAFAEELAPYTSGFIYRPFDSYSLMVRDKHGKATGPRYTIKSYVERTDEFSRVLAPTKPFALEVGNELSPSDTEWLPLGIWGCVAKAIECAKGHGVPSLVTWFAWTGMEAWMERQPLKPDIAGVSIYPRSGEVLSKPAALLILQQQLGDTPKMISEYGGQGPNGEMPSGRIESMLIRDFETYVPDAPVTQYLGSISWNALSISWDQVRGVYSEVWK